MMVSYSLYICFLFTVKNTHVQQVRHFTITRRRKRPKRHQRLMSLGHGYVFLFLFSLFSFLFTNEIFRCCHNNPLPCPPPTPHQQVNDNGTAPRCQHTTTTNTRDDASNIYEKGGSSTNVGKNPYHDQMHRVDSFIKESQRLNPLSNRK